MANYKWADQEQNEVSSYNGSFITRDGYGWEKFQQYLVGGGLADPFRTQEEWMQNALLLLKQYHSFIITTQNLIEPVKQGIKLTKALRKEGKGEANTNELKILNDNDVIGAWLDDMEAAAEGIDYGKAWIEDPARTEQEFIDYDPSLVPWPTYPL